MSRVHCRVCEYYDPSRFECHKSPPVRLPRKFAADAEAGNRVRDEELIWGWPETKYDDWCAEGRHS
jgi:hypothetical protein